MSDAPKKLSVLAVVSCVLGIGGIAMLTPLGSFAQYGIEEGIRNVLVLPVAAVIVGLIALRRTRKGSRRKGRLIASLGVVLGSGVVALIVTYLGLRLHSISQRTTCGNNQEQIVNAARTAMRDQKYYDEPENQMRMLLEQLPNDRLPNCPAGGEYTIETPSGYGNCSKHGDIYQCKYY
jgi:hypothetical protein